MKLKRVLAGFMAAVVSAATLIAGSVTASAASDDKETSFSSLISYDVNPGYLTVQIGLPYDDYVQYKNLWYGSNTVSWYASIRKDDYEFILYADNEDKDISPGNFWYAINQPDDTYLDLDKYKFNYDYDESLETMLYQFIVPESNAAAKVFDTEGLGMFAYTYYGICNNKLLFGDNSSLHYGLYSLAKTESDFTISKISDKAYTGKAIKPSVTVKDGDKKLVKGTDYTVSYKNNTKIGTATVIVTGKGKYSGTKELTFNIVPKKTKISIDEVSKSKAVINWKQSKGADGYEIWCSTNGESYTKLSTIKSAKTLTKTISKLNTQKNVYKFRVRPYAKVNGKTVYGSWSNIVSAG